VRNVKASSDTARSVGNDRKVIVGMSGGVDSSVAALLLQRQGYEVEGLFMKNWEEDDNTDYCTAKEDLADAESVCARLGIPLHQANFAAEYWDNVFEHFLSEYELGRTPNPDILCNREIKFKVFLDYAQVLGAEYVATGHYARLRHEGAKTLLLRGLDANKDQSYFLQAVSSAELEKCLFPVGELQKSEVRAIAAENELDTFDKKDSTGICFIGERRFKDFLQTYIPARSGVIETLDGEVIGQHQGLMYHTLGQRQGLGIGGVKHGLDAPWYVVAKDMDRNVLIVAQGNDHPAMLSDGMICEDIHWVSDKPSLPDRLQVKCRYRQADQACIVRIAEAADGGVNDDQLEVVFDQPQRAVTPGQWACFYDHDVCLGGGIIKETYRGAAARRDQ